MIVQYLSFRLGNKRYGIVTACQGVRTFSYLETDAIADGHIHAAGGRRVAARRHERRDRDICVLKLG